jgi:hypothetical protein
MLGGEGADAVAVAEQDGGDDLLLNEAGGGSDDPDVFAFRENDTFRVPAELIE